MKDIIEIIKSKAKQLTLDITQVGEKCTKEQLYDNSLELLMNIHELETIYNKKNTAATQTFEPPHKTFTRHDRINENSIKDEINKVQRKLPNWATRQHQINAKILTLYLRLQDEGNTNITEEILMEKYNNQSEFHRNFPQMKIISPKNHGKVFEVQNGIIEIWEPVQDFVNEYRRVVFNSES